VEMGGMCRSRRHHVEAHPFAAFGAQRRFMILAIECGIMPRLVSVNSTVSPCRT
jgi:hypothetical protein